MVTESRPQNIAASGGGARGVAAAGRAGPGIAGQGRGPVGITIEAPQKGEQLCKVVLLDGVEMELGIDKKAKGQALFDKVLTALNVFERDYFGLTYRDADDRKNWLDNEKPISKQLKKPVWVVFLEVKFYPPEPSQLKEDITRYLLCLQVRNDIVTGKLPCSFFTHCLLASYLAQSTFGDYDECMGPDCTYLANFQMAPNFTSEMSEKVHELHKTYRGQTPAEAELHYLENAKKLAMYGVDLHPAKDSDNVDILLGVSYSGLMVFRDKLRINRFAWPKILAISFRRKYFYLKIRPGEFEQYENTVGFKLLSHRDAKRLWKRCVEHHAFFRLMTPEVPNKEKAPLLPRIGSSRYRYAGRTQYQSRLASSLLDRPAPAFQRNQSQHVPNSFSLDSGMSSRAQPQPTNQHAPDEAMRTVGFIDAKSSGDDNLAKSHTLPPVTSGAPASPDGPAISADNMHYRGAPVIPYAAQPGQAPQNLVLSDQEQSDLRRAFELFDKDKNGRITPDEIREVIRSTGMEPKDAWVDQLIKDADLDGNGTIEWREFVRAMGRAGSGMWLGSSKKDAGQRVSSPHTAPTLISQQYQQPTAAGVPEQRRDQAQPVGAGQQRRDQVQPVAVGQQRTDPTRQVGSGAGQQQPQYTEEQLKDLRRAFQLFDRDQNGHITPQELRDVIRQAGMQPNDEWIAQLIEEADADRNGSIEFEEFIRAMNKGWMGLGRAETSPSQTVTRTVTRVTITEHQLTELKKQFNMWDKDGNGEITPEELREVLHQSGMNPDEPWVGQFIAECDTNKDGKISWPEFLRLMTLGAQAKPAGEPTHTNAREVANYQESVAHSPSSAAQPPSFAASGGGAKSPDGVTRTTTTRRVTRVVITETQLKELRRMFELWDTDGNGVITPDELHDVVRQAGMNTDDEWVEEFITECDTNRDGKIQWDEFLRLMTLGAGAEPSSQPTVVSTRAVSHPSSMAAAPGSARSQEGRQETHRTITRVVIGADQLNELRKTFEMWDKDGNGYITPDDIREVLKSAGMDPNAEWIDHFITECDSDRDNRISWPEFLRLMTTGSAADAKSGSPVQTEARVVAHGTVAASPADYRVGSPEKHVERSQEVSEGDPNVRTERIVNPDGSITTRTVTSKVKTVKQTVRTTQMVPIEASGHGLREEEVSALRQAFDMFDHDKDGRITRSELREVILSVGKKPTDPWLDQLMQDADKDNSGAIEWAEFLRVMTQGGGLSFSGPSSSGSPPIVQTKTFSASYGTPGQSDVSDGGAHGGTFMSSQVVDSGGRVVGQETYKTEKDGVVEIKTVKKVMMVHSPDEADPEAALTAAILEATKVDPNVVVEKVEYKHQTQS